MTDRKFYKQVITVTVLAEEPFGWDDLDTIHEQITDGDCSGVVEQGESQQIDGKQAAEELINQGSDPDFFRLTEDGEDSDTE